MIGSPLATAVPKAGDVVMLKSGGAKMTVERRFDPVKDGPAVGPYAGDLDCLCIWHLATGELKSHWFPDAVLNIIPQTAPPSPAH